MNKTTDFYDQNAKTWIENHEDVQISKPFIDLFVQNLTGPKILDVGCGLGNHSKYFLTRGLQVTGIDLSQSFINFAKLKNPKINFIKMDMQNLQFEKEEFDGLWVYASLLHLKKENVTNTLKGFNKILKNQGLIFISVKKHPTRKKENRFFEYYSLEELSKLVQSSSFKILKIEENEEWIDLFANKITSKT